MSVTLAAALFDVATIGYSQPARTLYRGPFAEVGDRAVAYRTWGSSGSPIVLLGGAAEPAWVWHAVGPLLAARHHRVFAIDLPPWGTYAKGHLSDWLGQPCHDPCRGARDHGGRRKRPSGIPALQR